MYSPSFRYAIPWRWRRPLRNLIDAVDEFKECDFAFADDAHVAARLFEDFSRKRRHMRPSRNDDDGGVAGPDVAHHLEGDGCAVRRERDRINGRLDRLDHLEMARPSPLLRDVVKRNVRPELLGVGREVQQAQIWGRLSLAKDWSVSVRQYDVHLGSSIGVFTRSRSFSAGSRGGPDSTSNASGCAITG